MSSPAVWRTWIFRTLAAIVLAIYFFAPVSAVLDASLDASNYGSYISFTAHGRQYGTEVVPMAGPFGFVVYGWIYNGELYWLRLALELLTKLALAASVLWFFFRARGTWLRWLWLAANLMVVPTTAELGYDFAILYVALYLLLARPPPVLAAGPAGFLAFIALCKGTQLVFTLAVLTLIGLALIRRRAWRDLAITVGAFFLALGMLWCAAGQNLRNLPAYLRNINELSTGYNSGMALQESNLAFFAGVTAFAVLLAGVALLFFSNRRNSSSVTSALLLGGFAFFEWKHGFVRADGHMFLFFNYTIVAGLTALLLNRVAGVETSSFAARATLCMAGIGVAVFGSGEQVLARLQVYSGIIIRHLPQALHQVARPSLERHRLDAELEQSRVRFALPELAGHVGGASVDFFGYQSGYLPLNHLHVHPHPVAGGGPFSVFTPHLQKLNADFVLSPQTRPEYYLLKLQTIDDHFVTQDDAGSLNAILQLYRPVIAERGMLLLRDDHRTATPPQLRELERLDVRPGRGIDVPEASPGEMVLASFSLPSSSVGLFRSALYKSPIITLQVTANDVDAPLRRRIVPSMARQPFIVSPFLDTTDDLIQLYTPTGGRAVRRLRFEASPSWGLASDSCTVTFFAQPRPAPLDKESFEALSEQLRYAQANRAPSLIESPNARAAEVEGRTVQQLEPPGRIKFALHGDERELLFDYGFDPEAYTRGTTDGADFIVELISSGQKPEQLFFSRRDPKTIAADRGRHHEQLWLPVIKPGDQLQLRTTGGVIGATDWDWTYYDNIRLHSGPLQLQQFPGFSVAPISVEGASPRMIRHENHDALLLNAPGKITFVLKGSERVLKFSAGLIPGAYTEGNTDGVEFVVEAQPPGGAINPLYRRMLRPKSTPADRGTQQFEINLPLLPPGTRLDVRADPGPKGDETWDWSYVADVRFE